MSRRSITTGAVLLVLAAVVIATIRFASPRDAATGDAVALDPSAGAEREALPANRPVEVPVDGYIGSDACRGCHAHHHKTWHASYHRTMTQVPTPENVRADFNDVLLETFGRTYRLTTDGESFFAEMDDPDWSSPTARPPRVTRQIVLMTGSHHEQDFWFESTPDFGRRVHRFPFVYRIEEEQWMPDDAVLLHPPGPGYGFGKWNADCIKCHTTFGRPRIDAADSADDPHGPFDSQVVEFGISCEACHGPGESHVLRHTAEGRTTGERTDRVESQPGAVSQADGRDQIVNPAKLAPERSAQVCGQCHSVFHPEGPDFFADGFRFRPGGELTDRVMVRPKPLREQPASMRDRLRSHPGHINELFWSDGVMRVLGREYTAMVESPCYQHGDLTCLSCHTMHPPADDPRPLTEWANDQLRAGMESNRACLQCHAEIGEDLTAHTHHAAESTGSRCYNCHMPPTAYGLLKAVHNHTIESPSVAASVATGRPNGCNLCHLDQSLGWTDRHLAEWYGTDSVELTDVQSRVPAAAIWSLSGDAGQRTLMAWAMGWPPAQSASGTDWQARLLAPLLNDPYHVVRFIAHRSLRTLAGFDGFEYEFVADEKQLKSASDRAMSLFRQQREANGQSVDLHEFIDDPDGKLSADILDTLQQQRDDRRMRLLE